MEPTDVEKAIDQLEWTLPEQADDSAPPITEEEHD